MEYLFILLTDPAAWIALAALATMEIVLGIDNLIFISILTNKLPAERRSAARRIGIGGALVLRLALFGTVAFIVKLTEPVLVIFGSGLPRPRYASMNENSRTPCRWAENPSAAFSIGSPYGEDTGPR